MILKKLKLKNYRNCKDLQLEFNDKKNIIIGKNAQGKTNVLESIYFLSTMKSERTSSITDLINFDEKLFNINCELVKNDTDIELDFIYTDEKKKETKINGVKTTIKEFKNVLKTVLFSTQDLLLLRGAPQNRRDWLDRAISQIYPSYNERLSKYDRIRIQKNNFLKENINNESLLDVYNEQLAIAGSNIIYLRKKFLKEIEKTTIEKHRQISGDEDFSMKYSCSFLDEEIEIENILEKFKTELELKREEEKRRAQSLIGPHKDDIEFFINNQNSLKYASQGQQRTIVLSLKLAELDIIKTKTNIIPILLLDDVLAELDDLRQNFLLKSVEKDVQTVITSVDTLLFNEEYLRDVTIFKIGGGKIIE